MFDRVGMSAHIWVDCVKGFCNWHASGVGHPESLKHQADILVVDERIDTSPIRQRGLLAYAILLQALARFLSAVRPTRRSRLRHVVIQIADVNRNPPSAQPK